METIFSFTKIKYKNLFYKEADRSKNFTAADCKTESTSSLISWSAKSLVRPLPIQRHCSIDLKGNSGRKKFSSNERAWKMQKMSHHWPQCAKWFSRYPISKSGIWARWTSPFCRLLASFSFKYDVRDAMLQDIEKMKDQYLRSLWFDLFEILKALREEQRNFAWCQISVLRQLKRE